MLNATAIVQVLKPNSQWARYNMGMLNTAGGGSGASGVAAPGRDSGRDAGEIQTPSKVIRGLFGRKRNALQRVLPHNRWSTSRQPLQPEPAHNIYIDNILYVCTQRYVKIM